MKTEYRDDATTLCHVGSGIKYIRFANLQKYDGIITHSFSTRSGGASTGKYSSLNLNFRQGDRLESVASNFRLLCSASGINPDNLVFSRQVHGSRVKAVDETDREGIFPEEKENDGFDALITDRRQTALVTFYADCVPVLFFDPVKKAIGMAHSGWRGTLEQIAVKTVTAMNKKFKCSNSDIIASVGPSIGKCCFEVGEDVYLSFRRSMEWSGRFCEHTEEGKWRIDLKSVVKRALLDKGLREENISVSSLCTKCRNDLFFSYRGDGGQTGCMAAVMQID